jgi:prepilin-type N-terminal cleavage/methylation domain-containing protein
MNENGFSLFETLIALLLLSMFMLAAFHLLQYFFNLEKDIQQDYVIMQLLSS